MSYRVVRFEDTPNPHAIKCVVEPSPGPVPRSYFNREQAASDPLARALFELPGVTNVLIHTAFITVSKSPSARWSALRSSLTRALSAHPAQGPDDA